MTAVASPAAGSSKKMIWAGRVVSAIPSLMLVLSGVMKLTHNPKLVEGFTHFGYQESALTPLGITELVIVALYAIPRTTFLGAVLMTGYLGGATATHVRVGDPFATPVILGVLVWVGLFLREPRFRQLAPIRAPE